jgi:hypothetical protein
MPAMRKPMPQPQYSPEGGYHICRDTLFLHCAQYVFIQTDSVAAYLVEFPKSSGEPIFPSSKDTSFDLVPQDRFRNGENFKHREQFQLASLRIEKLLNFTSCKTDKSRLMHRKRPLGGVGGRTDAS